MEIEISEVVKKLQNKVSEQVFNIAVLEAQVEKLEELLKEAQEHIEKES